MSLTLIAILIGLGVFGGLSAGVLGFGGGVLMFPLLYYVPPLFGVERFDGRVVAGIVISQVFFSTLVGGFAHLRSGRVQGRLTVIAGSVSGFGALLGGIASKWASERFLITLFGLVTLIVMSIMLLSPAVKDGDAGASQDAINFARSPLIVGSLAIGAVVGFLGAGNFVFVPFLIYVLGVPTRMAIGSSLFIGAMNSASGFIGKLLTAQVPLLMTAIVVAAAICGALIGERIHPQLSVKCLRVIYVVLVTLIAVRVWLGILVFDN